MHFIQNVYSQEDPAELFDIYCADCHSIGEGDMQGPDLMGIEQRHSNEWLVSFIRSAKTMVNSGDAQAVTIYNKFDQGAMPDTDLSTDEIHSIITYIKGLNKNVIEDNSEPTKTQELSAAELPISEDTEANIPSVVNEVLDKNEYDERLNEIEEKLDMILEFHKKSLAARITNEEISKGEALFEGRMSFTNNVPACAGCHNTYKIDTLNWNPSAYDIASTYSQRPGADMINLIINPVSQKMKEVLKDQRLTDDESFYITAYLQNIERTGLKEHLKIPVRLIMFIIFCVVLLLTILDLLFTRILKRKFIYLIFTIIPGFFIIKILSYDATNIGISQNYAPDQPIKFSHKIHVKENSIECLFCHNSPEYSRESGIPTTNVCMICHNKIRTGVHTGEFEINKIIKSYNEKKSIEWIKIHNLPDHVFFSHAQHVSIAKIQCQKCHGNIEDMNVTKQYASLSMGWCIQCHRETDVQFEQNNYYSSHIELHNDLRSGKIKEVTADKIGANDCQKCHY